MRRFDLELRTLKALIQLAPRFGLQSVFRAVVSSSSRESAGTHRKPMLLLHTDNTLATARDGPTQRLSQTPERERCLALGYAAES
jgi:hypothetical protein